MAKSVRALAPGFLVASPPLNDPNFERTLVLLAVHGPEGALGFVVNRFASMSLGTLLESAGYGDAAPHATAPVYLGGPVRPSSGAILCIDPSLDGSDDAVVAIGERIRITSSKTAFGLLARDLADRKDGELDPKRRAVILGYSGWGPGQLESEIARGAWLPAPYDERVLFDTDIEDRWERAYALLGLTPAAMMSSRGVGQA